MDILGLATRGYLTGVGGSIVVGDKIPDVIGAASDKPDVGAARLEVAPAPSITGSRETRPTIRGTSTGTPRVSSPTIIGSSEHRPVIRKK